MKTWMLGALGLFGTGLLAGTALAEPPRALPAGQAPQDTRLGALRTLDDYAPFMPVADAEAWQKRSAALKRQVLVATGLWPMPPRTPLNAEVYGKVERDDYTVEKVHFESIPGHYVTGSLYRPKGDAKQKRPAVLCPHGHWAEGRFHDHGEAGVRKEIEQGAERFERGGRTPLQARCVQLARMGCVVFIYDMEGYADSVQLPHRAGVRREMNDADEWGFFSPQAELRLQNMMGLQTWNSIRAADFITALPDVDASRLAVTGASGGGTQTFILAAVDDRPAVLFPAVMVSTGMQGGCTCENATYLRLNAGNIDLAALAAPRPLGMTSADDWTKEQMTKGFPDLKNLYTMLGHPDRVAGFPFLQFGHNYNAVSRMAMEGFLNQHLNLGVQGPVVERDFEPLTREEASVWDADHPKPTGDQIGPSHEKSLLKLVTAALSEQIDALAPGDEYRRVIGGGWDVILGRRIEDVGELSFDLSNKSEHGGALVMTGLLTHHPAGGMPSAKPRQEQIPLLFLHPKENCNGQAIVCLTDAGKSVLVNEAGEPQPEVAKLVADGYSVVGVDYIGQGEFGDVDRQRIAGYGQGNEAWQQSVAYTFGYNHPLFSQRVQDVLSVVKFVRTNENHRVKRLHLVGIGKTAGVVAAGARAQAGAAIDRAAIDLQGFTFASVDRFDDPMFVPGAVKYQDVAGLVALGAPGELWLAGMGAQAPFAVRAAYRGDALQYSADNVTPEAIIEWIKK